MPDFLILTVFFNCAEMAQYFLFEKAVLTFSSVLYYWQTTHVAVFYHILTRITRLSYNVKRCGWGKVLNVNIAQTN